MSILERACEERDAHAELAAKEHFKRYALLKGLRELKADIEVHATDTVWVGPAETACDRIEQLLINDSQSSGETNADR